MSQATGEWVRAGRGGLTAPFLTYEEQLDGVGRIWIARSILTGHVCSGTSEASAKECLRRTIAGSIEQAERQGETFNEWLQKQRPDEPRFVEEYFNRARAGGQRVEESSFGGNTITVAPAQ